MTTKAGLAVYQIADGAAYVTGEVVTIDGGEWLSGAGEFNELIDQPESFWEALRQRSRR